MEAPSTYVVRKAVVLDNYPDSLPVVVCESEVDEAKLAVKYLYENWHPPTLSGHHGRPVIPYHDSKDNSKKQKRQHMRRYLRINGVCPVCKVKELKLSEHSSTPTKAPELVKSKAWSPMDYQPSLFA